MSHTKNCSVVTGYARKIRESLPSLTIGAEKTMETQEEGKAMGRPKSHFPTTLKSKF
jgi:hypothetical protein